MCGIVGIVSKWRNGFNKDHQSVFEDMLYADGLRGADSTGAFSVTYKNSVRVVKQAGNPGIFLLTQTYKNFKDQIPRDCRIVVGHNRKATWGDINTKNAHPFTDGKIVLVHNGYIANHENLAGKKLDVDSEAIVKVLSEEKDVLKGLQSLCGAYAIVWYNHATKRLHLARNDQRPLAVAVNENYVFFASEIDMLKWVLIRNKIRWTHITDIPDNEVWTLEFDNFKMTQGKIPEQERVSRIPAANADEGSCDVTFDPAFSLGEYPESHGKVTLTEEERIKAQALADRMTAEANSNMVDPTVEHLTKLYPGESKALFRPKIMSPGPHYIKTAGEMWVPGKRPVRAEFHVLRAKDEELYLEQDVPLDCIVACPARKGEGFYMMIKGVRIGSVLADAQNQPMSTSEWHMIVDAYTCHSCNGKLNRLRPDTSMVVKGLNHSYEVTCDKCMLLDIPAKKIEGMDIAEVEVTIDKAGPNGG